MKFTQTQLNHLSKIRFINRVDDKLKIVSSIRLPNDELSLTDQLMLVIELFYEGDKISVLTFNLHHFNYEEIVDIASNIQKNHFIMQEIDTYLAGEIE